jgi:DHA3 family tetracycline resistance protein-like MFS transporter
MATVSGLTLLTTLAFALSGDVYAAMLMYVVLIPLRSIAEPLTTTWVNQHTGAGARATVLSMHSQADALGQVVGGPGVGMVGQLFGIRVAIAATALLLSPAVWLYLRARHLKVAT